MLPSSCGVAIADSIEHKIEPIFETIISQLFASNMHCGMGPHNFAIVLDQDPHPAPLKYFIKVGRIGRNDNTMN